MKIEKLNIYGFGKHENLMLNLTDGINILYGLNEAGKTTIQQFILHILFGFPSKNQQLLRYEPKSGLKYGGQVHLLTEEHGKVIVERVKGKAAGDVTVHFADGTKGDEEDLKSVLYYYDRASFESIFSFSLMQLQGFEKMDEMELSRTLLASGTTGVDHLTEVEKKMQRDMGDIFKPTGRKPEMNILIEELRSMELELKEERKKVEQYEPALLRVKEIELELERISNEERALKEKREDLALYRQAVPLLLKKKTIEQQLESYRDLHFPADGIRRMDSIEARLLDVKTAIQRLEAELAISMDEQEKAELELDLELLQNLLARESEWHHWRSTIKQGQEQMRKLINERNDLISRLGLKNPDVILEWDLSLSKEERLQHLLSEKKALEERQRFLQQQREQLANDRYEAERGFSDPLLNEEETKMAASWPQIQRKLAEAKAYLSLSKSGSGLNNQSFFIMLSIVFIASVIYGLWTANYPVAVLSGVMLAVSVLMIISSKSKKKDNRAVEMRSIIDEYGGREAEFDQLYRLYLKQNETTERLKADQDRIRHKQRNMEAAQSELEQLSANNNHDLERFMSEYGFNRIPNVALLPEMFNMMRQLQSIVIQLLDIDEEIVDAAGNVEKRLQEANHLLGEMIPEEELYGAIRRQYSERTNEKYRLDQIQASMVEKIDLKMEKQSLYAALVAEKEQLLSEASADSIDSFYGIFNRHKEKEGLRFELSQVSAQLHSIGMENSKMDLGAEEAAEQIRAIDIRMEEIGTKTEELQREKVKLDHLTGLLLNDETYGIKLQQFEMKKAELAALAEKWAVYKTVSEAINRMMRNLKENKLPEVLDKANDYFCHLTEGRYEEMSVTDNGLFEAVSIEGIRYPISELSQATKEQAYISLRFALAQSVIQSAPFPIILDDPFVHFDRGRLQQMVKLMEQLKMHHQILYFTCHDHMLSGWEDATVIRVNRANEKGVVST